MKLLLAIVRDEDANRLIGELMGEGFSVTKLASTGGFLKAGNTTLLMGVENERLEQIKTIIKNTCQCRKQLASAPVGMAGTYLPYSFEVTVGGATVFIMDADVYKV